MLPLSQCAVDVSKSYHKPTWTLAVDHDLWDGTMVYATMRSGYRSGGINTQANNTAALTALPEEVQDYEIGVKSDLDADGHAGARQSGGLSDQPITISRCSSRCPM